MEYGYNISCFIFYVCPSLKKRCTPLCIGSNRRRRKTVNWTLQEKGVTKGRV